MNIRHHSCFISAQKSQNELIGWPIRYSELKHQFAVYSPVFDKVGGGGVHTENHNKKKHKKNMTERLMQVETKGVLEKEGRLGTLCTYLRLHLSILYLTAGIRQRMFSASCLMQVTNSLFLDPGCSEMLKETQLLIGQHMCLTHSDTVQ